MTEIKRIAAFALCAILVLVNLAALGEEIPEALKPYAKKRIGVLTGSIHDRVIKQSLPEAEELYYSSVSDEVTALDSGVIDAFSCDILTAHALMDENDSFAYVDEALEKIPTAYAFGKDENGAKLCAEMSAYIEKLDADGTLKELQDKWLSAGAGDYDVDMSDLSGKERTLVFATSCSGKPNAYYFNNKVTGYEVEIAAMFCREYGYGLKIEVLDFSGIIPGIYDGKYDFAADGIAVTSEREESVSFSTPDYYSAIVLVYKKDETAVPVRNFSCIEDMDREDVALGMITGSVLDQLYAQYTPKAELKYYNSTADVMYALSKGIVEGVLLDAPLARYLIKANDGLKILDEEVGEACDFGFVFGNSEFDETLLEQYNEFQARLIADGTLAEMSELWFGEGEAEATVEYDEEGPNGVVHMATCSSVPPIVYVKNGRLAGLEIDIFARFCREYGYGLEIEDMDFGALLNSVQSGRNDIATGYITITEERSKIVHFSDPYAKIGVAMIVRAPEEKKGFWAELAASFERTFIREERWKLIVQGIGTTMYISVCAALLGTLLGFGLCMLRRMKNRIVFGITTAYIRIMQGTPILVILMILYYLVFAKSGLSGELVAIFAFALNFAAYVSEIFRSGIEAIDRGQREAALAIGFTRSQAFFRIVLPQAAMRFLPVYKGEFISMVKMTSIVGYIAVQDLTKMSDIIRSRTYEAFFPLISTAVIYFLLSSLLTSLLRLIEVRIEPDRVNRKVKGVKMK